MPLLRLKESYEGHPLRWWHLPLLAVLIAGTYLAAREYNASPSDERTGAPWPTGQVKHNAGNVFGTVYHLTYQSPADLQQPIDSLLAEVDASLSPFNPTSTISHINDNTSTRADERLARVFTLAKQVSAATEGAFDITVAPLVNAWGFGFRQAQSPDSLLIDSLLQFVGFSKVTLTPDSQIIKTDPRVLLDCAAIAKGFAVDEVADWLQTQGVANYMVEIGGELRLAGTNPEGTAWRIGVNNPRENDPDAEPLQAVLCITNTAVATSGNYRNYYEQDGRIIAHTIDPRTGYPVQRDILSATVLAPTCAEADAYATAFMASGMPNALRILTEQPHLAAHLIYTDTTGKLLTWQSDSLPQ